jgi:murein DD-endopeptidase MepM/ murein hydrolase activator NlpD
MLAEVWVADSSAASDRLSGVVAGEPLHFEVTEQGGRFWALVPVPLGSADTLDLQVVRHRDDASDTLRAHLRVRHRKEPMQVLHLPAPFDRPPDSATTARLEGEAAVLDSILARAHDAPRLWHHGFVRPVPGRVTTAFGAGREIDGMTEPRHEGVDLAGAKGSAVRAPNRAVVVLVTTRYESGLTVVLDHGAGLVTTYGHLSRALVAAGDTVDRGQVLGRVGATGRATGPHLHWGAFYGALPVDPLSLLALDGPS